jgi:hypothetical protein
VLGGVEAEREEVRHHYRAHFSQQQHQHCDRL